MTSSPGGKQPAAIRMPSLGLGVWQIPEPDVSRIVAESIRAGYRAIDTAMIYGNEAGVGAGLAACGLPREQLFVTTKLWNTDQPRDRVRPALLASLRRLGLEYVDLYLMHWPVPMHDQYVGAWDEMLRLQSDGLVRSVGVSNFLPEHLDRIVAASGVTPAVNQIEYQPAWQPTELQRANAKLGIVTEAWSPLGHGAAVTDPTILRIAAETGHTPSQVVIAWHLMQQRVVIPKPDTVSQAIENFAALGVELTAQQCAAINSMARPDGRCGPDPMTFVE